MTKSYDVLGIGNPIMDIIAPVSEQFLTDHNIAKGGMTLIDEETALALNTALKAQSDIREVAGGSMANSLYGIAQLGVKAAYMGKLAQDDVGTRYSQSVNNSGLNFATPPAENGSTGRCMIAVTPDGQRSMSTLLGVAGEFTQSDMDSALIEHSAVTYLEGYLFNSEGTKSAFTEAAKIARKAGNQVALTLSDSFCVDFHRADFKNMVEHHIDILFANEDEILALYETTDIETAFSALEALNITACITRGEKGSMILSKGERYAIAAQPVDKVIDTTGAGDQYAAGVLAGRALGLDWQRSGAIGSIAAAEVIGHYGARPETSIKVLAREILSS